MGLEEGNGGEGANNKQAAHMFRILSDYREQDAAANNSLRKPPLEKDAQRPEESK